MKNKKIWREKKRKICSPQYQSELWRAIEVNNELKVNVDEQQDDITLYKDQHDRDNEDEVHENCSFNNPQDKEKSLSVWHVIKQF